MSQHLKRRQIERNLRAAAAAGVLLATAACGGDDDSADTDTAPASSPVAGTGISPSASTGSSSPDASDGSAYKVVLASDLTGPLAGLGLPFNAGFISYFHSIGDTVNGHEIDVNTVLDTQSDPNLAQGAFRQAIEAEPIAMSGFTLSSSLVGAQSLLDTAAIPTVSGGEVTQLNGPPPASGWFFAASPAGNDVIDAMIAKLQDLLGGSLEGTKVAIGRSESAGIDNYVKNVEARAAELGFEIVAIEAAPPGAASFSSQAANIVRSDPDGVLTFGISNDVITQVRALDDAGLGDVPIIQFHSSNGDAFLEAINLPNFYVTRDFAEPRSGDEMFDAATAAGVAEVASDTFFAKGWVAAALLAEGLRTCADPCAADGLIESLESIDGLEPPAESAFGPLSFSADDHVAASAVAFFRWDDTQGAGVQDGDPVALPALS